MRGTTAFSVQPARQAVNVRRNHMFLPT